MDFKFTANGDMLEYTRTQGHTGNINVYECIFDFNGEWDGLSKFLAVKTANECITPIEITNNRCMIPQEALESPGIIYIGVYGTTGTASDYKRISTNWVGLRIDEGAYCEGTAPAEPTPDTWETYLAKVQALADRAELAETGAITAETEAAKAEQTAKDAAANAQDAEAGAEAAAQSAQLSAGEADTYRAAANDSAGEAWTSAQLAEEYKTAAVTASADAYQYSQDAQDAKNSVDTSKQSIESYMATVEYLASQVSNDKDTALTAKDQALSAQEQTARDAQAAGTHAAQTAADRKAVSDDKAAVLAAKVAVVTAKGQVDAAKQSVDTSKLAVDTAKSEIDQQAAYIQSEVDRIESLDTYTKQESDMRYLPKGTAAGYPLTVSDHLEDAGVINYRIQGNTKPENGSGKNLFNIDELTPKTGMTKDGTQIIFDSETYVHMFTNISLYKRLLPNATYTISTVYTGEGLDGISTGSIRMTKPTNEVFEVLPSDAASCTNKYRTNTFTTPSDIGEYTNIYLCASQNRGVTIYDKIQIELGETATDYEPYSALMGVGDLVETGEQAGKYHVPVTICGKNWLDEAYFKERSNLTADASSYYGAQVKLLPDTQYTFSRKDNAGYNAKVNNRNVYAKIVAGGTSYLFMHTTSQANNRQTFTFTTGADGLAAFSFYPCFSQAECDGFWDLLGWCQIELGAAQTAYEPYTADTADIYLDAPLQTGESISYTADNLPAITAPQSSAMTILAETQTPPAEISAEYYQDINKKILELQNAMIAGGTANV